MDLCLAAVFSPCKIYTYWSAGIKQQLNMYIAVKLVCEVKVVVSISNSLMFYFVSVLFTKLVKNTCRGLLTTHKSLIQ